MIRISNNTNNIVSIKRIFSDIESWCDIDSFFIIPGITIYNSIYQIKNTIIFSENSGSDIEVMFNSSSDLERFFVQFMRDIKLNHVLNVPKDIK